MNAKEAREIVNGGTISAMEFDKAKGFLDCYEQVKPLVEALEKTLVALVSYKKYIPQPYKQNPIYIIGAHEAEKLAIEALSHWRTSRGEE